jgi:hypothetical protein
MYRAYAIPMKDVTVNSGTDMMWVFANPGTTQSLEFFRAVVSQTGSTTNAQEQVGLAFKVTAFPTLTSQAPVKLDISDPASVITGNTTGAAGTSGVNASAAGGGAATYTTQEGFSTLNGWLWQPGPFDVMRANASAASGFGICKPAVPGSTGHWCATLFFREC